MIRVNLSVMHDPTENKISLYVAGNIVAGAPVGKEETSITVPYTFHDEPLEAEVARLRAFVEEVAGARRYAISLGPTTRWIDGKYVKLAKEALKPKDA